MGFYKLHHHEVLCFYTIFQLLGTDSLFWNGYADYWFAIFSVLNFCDWGTPWFQQSSFTFHISLLFLSLVISWFHGSVFWKLFHFAGTVMKLFFVPLTFYPIFCWLLTLLSSILQQTIWLFFRDLFKGVCLAVILGPLIVSAIIVIVQVSSCANN